MISKRLVKEVVKEAVKLREHATSVELNRIVLSRLDPQDTDLCIYGQATGDCYSKRAEELIGQCATIVISAEALNDAPCQLPLRRKTDMNPNNRRRSVFSPIEVYIGQEGADNAALIRFLKGKTETLDLSHTVNC